MLKHQFIFCGQHGYRKLTNTGFLNRWVLFSFGGAQNYLFYTSFLTSLLTVFNQLKLVDQGGESRFLHIVHMSNNNNYLFN